MNNQLWYNEPLKNQNSITKGIFYRQKIHWELQYIGTKEKRPFQKLNIPRKRNGRRESFIPMDIKGAQNQVLQNLLEERKPPEKVFTRVTCLAEKVMHVPICSDGHNVRQLFLVINHLSCGLVYLIIASLDHRSTPRPRNIRIMGMGLEHEDCLNVPQIPIISLSIA